MPDAAAVHDRRLHGFLRFHSSRNECRKAVSARQSAAAELQAHADRLSRTRVIDRHQRHARKTSPTGSLAKASSVPPSGSIMRWSWECLSRGQPARRFRSRSERRGAPVRILSRERLVGTRYSALGVSAAGTFLVEELRDFDIAVGGHARGARAVSLAGPCTSDAGAVCRISGRQCLRHHARGLSERAVNGTQQYARSVLDARADDRASHFERMQPSSRRSAGERYRLGRGADMRADVCSRCGRMVRSCRMATRS